MIQIVFRHRQCEFNVNNTASDIVAKRSKRFEIRYRCAIVRFVNTCECIDNTHVKI